MRVLCCCEHGNNRSVHFSHLIKYMKGNETLTCGLKNNSVETLEMLFKWADKIVVVENELMAEIPNQYTSKIKLYNVGMDVYPRPFNAVLLKRAKQLMELDPL